MGQARNVGREPHQLSNASLAMVADKSAHAREELAALGRLVEGLEKEVAGFMASEHAFFMVVCNPYSRRTTMARIPDREQLLQEALPRLFEELLPPDGRVVLGLDPARTDGLAAEIRALGDGDLPEDDTRLPVPEGCIGIRIQVAGHPGFMHSVPADRVDRLLRKFERVHGLEPADRQDPDVHDRLRARALLALDDIRTDRTTAMQGLVAVSLWIAAAARADQGVSLQSEIRGKVAAEGRYRMSVSFDERRGWVIAFGTEHVDLSPLHRDPPSARQEDATDQDAERADPSPSGLHRLH